MVRSGQTLGTLLVMRRESGGWSSPVALRDKVGVYVDWIGNSDIAVTTEGFGIDVVPVSGGATRALYAPVRPSDPKVFSLVHDEEARMLYFKALDVDGKTTLWSIPSSGGKPRLLVEFNDPARVSIRGDFAAGGGQLFFALEDRQADIWVADINRR
jgi:hypothetical protein